MITSSKPGRPLTCHRVTPGRWGFSLIEVMMSVTAGFLVLAGVMTSYLMATRGLTAAGSYAGHQHDMRSIFGPLASDVRHASGLTNYSPTDIALMVVTNITGGTVSSKVVRYYQGTGANSNNFYRDDAGTARILSSSLKSVSFTAYDKNLSTSGVDQTTCKLLKVNLSLQKTTFNTTNNEQTVSARLVLRNKVAL